MEVRSMQEVSDRLLSTREVAARLGVSVRTVQDWRYRGGGPPGVALGRKTVRYSQAELERWLAEKREQEAARDGAA
jgi:excisionase family DNA binding protein